MAQTRYECSQCDKLLCNEAAAVQHNRDMHGSCADIFPLRSRRDLLTEIARHKRDKDALHSTIENCVSVGASLQAEIARLTAERDTARAETAMAFETAKKAIADLPTPRSEEVMEGHEQAYRAVEALKPTETSPTFIELFDERRLHDLWTMGNCRMSFSSFKERIVKAQKDKPT